MEPQAEDVDKEATVRLSHYASLALRKCYVLPVAKACNASCVFCATSVYDPSPMRGVMRLNGLRHAIARLSRAGVNRYEVTGGGEPTLHPHLVDVLSCIRDASRGGYIKLYSNGERLVDGTAVDELNVSRCALDIDANQLLMRLHRGSPRLDDLVKAARRLQYKRIRLSVPIIRGGVDCLPKAAEFLTRVAGLVDAVVFRPLYPATPGRAGLDPMCDTQNWTSMLARLAPVAQNGMEVEVDVDGCFRSRQLILASNLKLYRDWSLRVQV
jgi:molybdenum cofactor biosynthesis enzyme MoaA